MRLSVVFLAAAALTAVVAHIAIVDVPAAITGAATQSTGVHYRLHRASGDQNRNQNHQPRSVRGRRPSAIR